MSNEVMALTEFTYESMGVRVFGTKEEPWFVAVDVLRALEISTKYMARTLQQLDDDEKSVVNLTTEVGSSPSIRMGERIIQGSHNTLWLISESGFYRIAFRSNKPQARAFTRFVTHEVLPSIRKYGYYANNIEAAERRKQLLEYSARIVEKIKAKEKSTCIEGVYVRHPAVELHDEMIERLLEQEEQGQALIEENSRGA